MNDVVVNKKVDALYSVVKELSGLVEHIEKRSTPVGSDSHGFIMLRLRELQKEYEAIVEDDTAEASDDAVGELTQKIQFAESNTPLGDIANRDITKALMLTAVEDIEEIFPVRNAGSSGLKHMSDLVVALFNARWQAAYDDYLSMTIKKIKGEGGYDGDC